MRTIKSDLILAGLAGLLLGLGIFRAGSAETNPWTDEDGECLWEHQCDEPVSACATAGAPCNHCDNSQAVEAFCGGNGGDGCVGALRDDVCGKRVFATCSVSLECIAQPPSENNCRSATCDENIITP